MTLAGFRNALINVWIFFDMWRIKFFLWDPFIRKTHRPQKIQDQLLQKIIEKNQDTQFGRAHGFDTIHSYQSFCDAVPVHTYEDLRTYIGLQENGNQPALNAEQPTMYSQTSGTTGKPKYIPVLPSTLAQYKVSQALFAWAQFRGSRHISRQGTGDRKPHHRRVFGNRHSVRFHVRLDPGEHAHPGETKIRGSL